VTVNFFASTWLGNGVLYLSNIHLEVAAMVFVDVLNTMVKQNILQSVEDFKRKD
jgi:hypothetical protein